MQNKYDVIVIGAGIGGLTAAAILVRNGKKVLVLEKNPVAGGYAVNFKRGNFIFDASLHLIEGYREGGVAYKILKKCGVLDKIQLLMPQYLYRSIFPDFDIRIPQGKLQEHINILTTHFPTERTGIEKLFKEMSELFSDIIKYLYSKTNPTLELLIFPFRYPTLFKYANKTFQVMLDKYLKDERLKVVISQLWPYYGLPPRKLSSFYFTGPSWDYFCNGGYYPKGGAQALTNSFLSVINENGGKIILNEEVKKIVIKNNLTKGVEVDKNEVFYADILISNIDARKTFLNLIGEKYLPKAFVERIRKLQPSISIFQVYLGLKIDLKKIGIFDYEIFYNPNYDSDQQFFSSTQRIDIKETIFCITLYSNLDSNAAPEEKSNVGITILSGYDYWASLKNEEYQNEKQRVAKELISEAERIIPNLSSYIETIEIATPLTMERYTGNYKGAIYGWSQIVQQSGINRPSNQTPIRNLYLASAWTRMGGGIFSTLYAGEQAAEKILRK